MRKSILWLVLALVIGACATPESLPTAEAVRRLQPGITSQQQVRQWLGEPEAIRVDLLGAARWNYAVTEKVGRLEAFQGTLKRWLIQPVSTFFDQQIYYPPLGAKDPAPDEGSLSVAFGADGVVMKYSFQEPGSR